MATDPETAAKLLEEQQLEEYEEMRNSINDAAEQQHEDIETSNVAAHDVPEVSSAANVYYIANAMKDDILFPIKRDAEGRAHMGDRGVKIMGFPVSMLRKPGGGYYPGGKVGVTIVNRDIWDAVYEQHKSMKMFTNGFIYWANTMADLKAMAKERGHIRHGMEPIDVQKDPKVKTVEKPKNSKE